MDIRILFMGHLAARFGREHVIDLEEGLTVRELRDRLVRHFPDAGPHLAQPDVRIAIDQTVALDTSVIGPGQEVAVLPIFSGG